MSTAKALIKYRPENFFKGRVIVSDKVNDITETLTMIV